MKGCDDVYLFLFTSAIIPQLFYFRQIGNISNVLKKHAAKRYTEVPPNCVDFQIKQFERFVRIYFGQRSNCKKPPKAFFNTLLEKFVFLDEQPYSGSSLFCMGKNRGNLSSSRHLGIYRFMTIQEIISRASKVLPLSSLDP